MFSVCVFVWFNSWYRIHLFNTASRNGGFVEYNPLDYITVVNIKVIAEYKKDLEADLAVKGPIWQTLQGIAKEIAEKQQKFAISCHCSPILSSAMF